MTRLIGGVVAMLAFGAAAHAQDVGGTYSVQGTNFDGTTYEGMAEIVASSDATCTITWTTGPTSSEGICMRDGNALAVGYTLGDAVGLGIYLIQEDGVLDGTWTIAGQLGSGTEVLTPQ